MSKGTRPATEDTATGASSAPPQRPARAHVTGEAEEPGTAAPTPAGHGQALAEAVVASFVERLKAEARRKGGTLTMEDLEALEREFQKKTKALQALFEQSFEEHVRTGEPARREHTRRNPFERLMVQRISHMFADGDAPLGEDNVVSRRMLPGFLMVMNMMLGTEAVARYRERCAGIVERVRGGRDDDASWDEMLADAEANEVVFDAQVAIALQFQDPEIGTTWMVDLVNGYLRPPDDAPGEGGDAAAWEFTEGACRRVLGALLSDLKQTLSTDGGRRALAERYGAKVCAALAEIMIRLDAGEPGDS